jgi:hypothetical protein
LNVVFVLIDLSLEALDGALCLSLSAVEFLLRKGPHQVLAFERLLKRGVEIQIFAEDGGRIPPRPAKSAAGHIHAACHRSTR